MPFLDALCRRYQSLFHHNHPDEARLGELHSSGQTDRFLQAYFDHEYQKGQVVVERFSQIATAYDDKLALDFGCGAGGLTYRIAQVCRHAVGIDLEQHKLDFAAAQGNRLGINNVNFICYDGSALPFEDASFDCIFCIDVIEHLPTPEFFVSEFRRLLVPGGQLLLSFGPPWCHPHGKHMWSKLPGWWTHLLFPRSVVMTVGGFTPETTWEQLGLHRLTVSKFRTIMKTSGLNQIYEEELINKRIKWLKQLPFVRELFVSEVVGVFQKQSTA